MDIAQETLTMFNDDLDLFKKVITVDEWVFGRKHLEEPRPKKALQVRSSCTDDAPP